MTEPEVKCGRCGVVLHVSRGSWVHAGLPPRKAPFHMATPDGRDLERWHKWKEAA